MQDHVSSHAAKLNVAEFERRQFWNLIKNWIQEHYPGWDKLSYKLVGNAVQQSWETIRWERPEDLLATTARRCEAVIAMYTKF
jgi:hypothetical protein